MIFIDVETTTLDEKAAGGIFNIAALYVQNNIIVDSFHATMCPEIGDFEIKDDVKEFFKSINFDYNEIFTYERQDVVFSQFILFLDKYINKYNTTDKVHFTAYNAHFDNKFVRAWFLKNNNKYFGSYFWSNNIDVMVLWSQLLKDYRHELPNFKLETLAKLVDIDINAHDSLSDITATFKLYLAYLERVTLKL